MRMRTIAGRPVWWHAQNLKREDGRGPMIDRRIWLNWGNIDHGNDGCVAVEWVVGKPVDVFDVSFAVHRPFSHDYDISAACAIWPFSFYVSLKSGLARRIAQRLAPRGSREIAFSIDRTTRLCWRVWTDPFAWSEHTPRWRDGSWNLAAAIFGDRRRP